MLQCRTGDGADEAGEKCEAVSAKAVRVHLGSHLVATAQDDHWHN